MFKILTREMLTPNICKMVVSAPRIAKAALPGQFLIVLANEEGERLAAVWYIWHAVVRGVLLDESLEDSSRDVMYESLNNNTPASVLAAKWGIKENNVYRLKNRGKTMANRVTRAIFETMSDKDVNICEEATRLYKAVSSMKPGKHVDKFMIALAKELIDAHK